MKGLKSAKAFFPAVAGAVAVMGTTMMAAPAQALTIVIDEFSNPIPGSGEVRDIVGGGATTNGPDSFTGTGLTGATRTFSVEASGQTGGRATIDVNSLVGELNQANGNNVSSVNLVTYNFNSADFASSPFVRFHYNADAGNSGSNYRFIFTLGGTTRTSDFLTADGPSFQEFDFRGVTLTGIQSAVLRIEAGNGRDISLSSPIIATVPVPPALLATGLGALIGGVKAARHKKQHALAGVQA